MVRASPTCALSDPVGCFQTTTTPLRGLWHYRSPSTIRTPSRPWGVATHEAGHAIQHARNYAPLWVRSALVPTANIGSSVGYFVMLIGLFMASTNMVLVGAVLFSAVLLFQVVTLPVEFNASNRAKTLVVEHGIVTVQERKGIDKVLNAAALTYVAAAVSTLLTLLYFLWRAGLIGGRRWRRCQE